jgi:excisionase family DNA binding protein
VNLAELPPALTVDQTAEVLSIGRGSAYEAVRRGEIPSVRLGRTIRVPRRALLELLGESDPSETREPEALSGLEGSRDADRDPR